MQKQKPIIDRSLAEMADDRASVAMGRSAAAVAGAMVNVGLLVSAFLTVFYLTLLVDVAAGLASPWGYILGLLVGVVAVVPAEMGMVIWRARLASDPEITTGQRVTAVTAMIAAGIFAALTTSSFFSYFLPQLFPMSYLAIAPSLNVGAIVGAWIVFILAIVSYSIFSRQTQQNLAQATAYQSVFDARMVVLKSAGEAIRLEAENMVNGMNESGVFRQDAQQLILASLGMEPARLALPAAQSDQSDGRQFYAVQELRSGRWVDFTGVPGRANAIHEAETQRDEANAHMRVVSPDGKVIAEFEPFHSQSDRRGRLSDPAALNLVDLAEAAHTNGAANFPQRPTNGRGQ
jgi:F0F1-type ATP synthase assembly protein I